jgi:hypothetical protein
MFVARHDRLVVTVSKREPSLTHPPAAAFSQGARLQTGAAKNPIARANSMKPPNA